MSSDVSGLRRAWWVCAALVCAALFAPADCAAQGSARREAPPRVGTIKDYPATGLMVGCGNWYFHLPRYVASPESFVAADQTMVFISNSEGGNAWMNLDGRDVRLTKIKPRRRARGRTEQPWQYRHGSLRVSVAFVEPKAKPANEDYTHTIIITLRKGRAVRTRRAVGYADC